MRTLQTTAHTHRPTTYQLADTIGLLFSMRVVLKCADDVVDMTDSSSDVSS